MYGIPNDIQFMSVWDLFVRCTTCGRKSHKSWLHTMKPGFVPHVNQSNHVFKRLLAFEIISQKSNHPKTRQTMQPKHKKALAENSTRISVLLELVSIFHVLIIDFSVNVIMYGWLYVCVWVCRHGERINTHLILCVFRWCENDENAIIWQRILLDIVDWAVRCHYAALNQWRQAETTRD